MAKGNRVAITVYGFVLLVMSILLISIQEPVSILSLLK
jgi:hypothetical protein